MVENWAALKGAMLDACSVVVSAVRKVVLRVVLDWRMAASMAFPKDEKMVVLKVAW